MATVKVKFVLRGKNLYLIRSENVNSTFHSAKIRLTSLTPIWLAAPSMSRAIVQKSMPVGIHVVLDIQHGANINKRNPLINVDLIVAFKIAMSLCRGFNYIYSDNNFQKIVKIINHKKTSTSE